MTTLYELRDQRSAAWAEAEEFAARDARGEKLTKAHEQQWQRALARFDELGRQIDTFDGRANRDGFDDLSADMRSRVTGAGDLDQTLDRSAVGEAFRTYLRTGEAAELRAMGVGTGPGGGYAVPAGFRAKVTETMKAYGGLLRLAEVVPTDDGTELPWPTSDDTANEGTGEQAENTPVAEQDATLGEATLGAYTYPSGIVKVSMQLMQDAGFPIDSWLARKLGQRIGRRQASRWISGTGTGQPQGILTGGTVGKTAGSATQVAYDDLVDLAASVDAAYIEGGEIEPGRASAVLPGVGWVMHQLTVAHLRKIKDLDDRPIIVADAAGRMPTTLFGYPIVVDNDMPTIAASARPIAFGNFEAGYVVRLVRSVEVLRLVERYAENLQHGFLGWQRADGLVQDPSAFKLLAMPAA